MDSNPANVSAILEKHPFSECEIETQGWDNIGEMVDLITIYPYRKIKKTRNFQSYLREKLFGWRSAVVEEEPEGKGHGEEVEARDSSF